MLNNTYPSTRIQPQKQSLLFLVAFPDLPKYKDSKFTMPLNHHYVMITGFLSDVKYVNNTKVDGVEYLVIDIKTIVFTSVCRSGYKTGKKNWRKTGP
jgi:hypothetical protein